MSEETVSFLDVTQRRLGGSSLISACSVVIFMLFVLCLCPEVEEKGKQSPLPDGYAYEAPTISVAASWQVISLVAADGILVSTHGVVMVGS